MKTKWYLFFLTIITVSIIFYNLFSSDTLSTYRIGVLMIGENRYEKYIGLRQGLNDLGYKDEEFSFIIRSANDKVSELNTKIDNLLEQNVDIIVALGAIETEALKKNLKTKDSHIPVVFAGVAAPKEIGIIEDYSSPGGNFTGINNYHTGLSGKRLELLKDLIPDINRVFALYDKNIAISRLSLEKVIEAGELISIKVIPVEISNYKLFIEHNAEENDALFILPSYSTESLIEEIVQISNGLKLPVMGLYENEVKRGYVASYGTSFFDQGYQSARFVSSIIQGNSPSELPVELPDTVRFLVNKRVLERFTTGINPDLSYISEFIEGEKEGSADQ